MKIAKVLIAVVVLGGLFTLSNCGSSSPAPEPLANQQFTKLQKTWKLTAVTSDGGASQFTPSGPYNSNFTLTISGTKGATSFDYAVAGRPPFSPWKASGKWAFGADAATQLVRDGGTSDELQMTYAVTDNTLQIQFNFPTSGGYPGRIEQVKGNWVFTFGL